VDGQALALQGLGSGPVDACVAALQSAFDVPLQVLDYHEHAIGSGAKAKAASYIEMRVGERRLHGVGIDADIVAASFKALLSGMARAGALKAEPAVAAMAQ
jgi:2-isopropylmalate synthase